MVLTRQPGTAARPGPGRIAGRLRVRGFAAGYLTVLAVLVVTAPLLPLDPDRQDLRQRLATPLSGGLDQWQFVLGGDALGPSVLGRLIYGAQVSLLVGLCSAALALLVGGLIGIAAGVWRGRFEDVAMRLVDMWMGIPTLLVALVVLFVLGPGVWNLILVLALLRWMVFARVARALTLSVRQNQFYEAAQSIGCSKGRIVFRHVVPSIKWDLLSLWTLEVALAMLNEAGLSFLGLGIRPPQSSWGSMLSEARPYMSGSPWLIVLPGLLIMVTTLCINLVVNQRRQRVGEGRSFWSTFR